MECSKSQPCLGTLYPGNRTRKFTLEHEETGKVRVYVWEPRAAPARTIPYALNRSRTSKEAGSQLASHKALLALSIRGAQKWE